MIPRFRNRGQSGLAALTLIVILAGCGGDPAADQVVLTGRAVLPADTFTLGPPVGAALDGEFNGRTPPFEAPPVQGFSSLVHLGGLSWAALQDNGFGSAANSPDYPLHVFVLRVDLDTASAGSVIPVRLTDPHGNLGFPPTRPSDDGTLGGADLDPESLAPLDDGSFWLGEEFGPFLVHIGAAGMVIEAPVAVPVPESLRDHARGLSTYRSPDHPDLRGLPEDQRLAAANLPRSGGIEGLARTPDGRLIAAVEKALIDDPVRDRRVLLEFDPATAAFTGRHWLHRMDRPDLAIASLEAWTDTVLLITERDEEEGAAAEIKRIYRLDLTDIDADGFVAKTLVCDLLHIADPEGRTTAEPGAIGLGPAFSFPFVTPECLVVIDAHTLVVANDNNYPFSNGRRPGIPDDTEIIRLVLPHPLTDPVR